MLYGRIIPSIADTLEKFRYADQKIANKYPIIYNTNNIEDSIEGVVFEVSKNELLSTDNYEGNAYHRTLVTLVSGLQAWCYVQQKEA